VAEEALEGALAGPAAVAVHDDGDVLRETGEVEGVVDRALLGRELVRPVGALIGAAGRGLRHVRLALLRIDDGREKRTGMVYARLKKLGIPVEKALAAEVRPAVSGSFDCALRASLRMTAYLRLICGP